MKPTIMFLDNSLSWALIILSLWFSFSCSLNKQLIEVVDKDGSLLKMSNGTVIDKKHSLMWSADDNGSDISFVAACTFIKNYRLAGYNDWRLPTLQELETLAVQNSQNITPPGKGCIGNYDIHPFFKLTCCCPWALKDNGNPASLPFIPGMLKESMWHHKSGLSGNRVLPVRDMER